MCYIFIQLLTSYNLNILSRNKFMRLIKCRLSIKTNSDTSSIIASKLIVLCINKASQTIIGI